jgi:hypothetical protein
MPPEMQGAGMLAASNGAAAKHPGAYGHGNDGEHLTLSSPLSHGKVMDATLSTDGRLCRARHNYASVDRGGTNEFFGGGGAGFFGAGGGYSGSAGVNGGGSGGGRAFLAAEVDSAMAHNTPMVAAVMAVAAAQERAVGGGGGYGGGGGFAYGYGGGGGGSYIDIGGTAIAELAGVQSGNGEVIITSDSGSPVPDSASTLTLLDGTLAGLAALRRRFAK